MMEPALEEIDGKITVHQYNNCGAAETLCHKSLEGMEDYFGWVFSKGFATTGEMGDMRRRVATSCLNENKKIGDFACQDCYSAR